MHKKLLKISKINREIFRRQKGLYHYRHMWQIWVHIYHLYFYPDLNSSSIFGIAYFIWQPITLMTVFLLFFFPYIKKCLVHLDIHNIHNTEYVYRPTIHRNKVRHNMKMIINNSHWRESDVKFIQMNFISLIDKVMIQTDTTWNGQLRSCCTF